MRVIIFLSLVASSLCAQEAVTVRQLDWLADCWDGSNEKYERTEQWMKPSGNMMLGMSRTVRNGQVREYEFMRIHQSNGDIYYTANPSGQAEASFRLVSLKVQEVVFENLDHDFPQRIGYKLESDGNLIAWIEGTSNVKDRKIEFPFRRFRCP